MPGNAILETRLLTKRFPGVTALSDVTFDPAPARSTGSAGENGAGKSTLIKTLSGIHPHGSYEGGIFVDGAEARLRNIADAQAAGIAVIYQELALVNNLTRRGKHLPRERTDPPRPHRLGQGLHRCRTTPEALQAQH